MRTDGLTPKHSMVLQRYILEFACDGLKAYRSVYTKCKDSTARSNFTDLLKKPSAQAYISELLKSLPATKAVSVEYVIAGIKKEAESADRPADRLRAYELLGKYLQIFKDTEINTTILSSDDYTAIRNTVRGIDNKVNKVG